MRKITFLIASLFIAIGAMAQTPVLELSASQIGTTYPYQLSDDDAQKVYALTDLTVAVRISNPGTSGRRGLFVTSDPTMEKNTEAEGLNSRYVAYGLNDSKASYLASWRTGDRFTGNNQTFSANDEITCVYVINPTNGKCEIYVNGELSGNWSGTNPNGFMNGYEIATPKMIKEDHPDANIYIGGGMSSEGAGEVSNGTITGVKVYSGALTAGQIAAISFEDPEALAQARTAFDAAYASAQAILNEANLSASETELALQTTNSNSAFYIWTNNPEESEGPITALVDGNTSNFFHTNWHGGGEEPHYIEVDLGAGNELSEFMFKYTTRPSVANDYPDAIQVLGSNDKSSYKEIYNVNSGLPQSSGKEWKSTLVSSQTAYRYLRFVVSAERTYWHMAEFDIVTNVISVADKYASVKNEVYNLKSLFDSHAGNSTYGASKLTAAAAALTAAVEAVNANLVAPEFSYENLDKPTFTVGGNTTKVAMIELNGVNQTGFTYTMGQTTRFDMPKVAAGQTYNLNLTYEMAWGDLAIFQIDKNSNEQKYGYYTCQWTAGGSPFATLVEGNRDFMCEELEILSLEELQAISANEATYLTIPYKITIDENLEAGDIVVVRVMVGKKDNGAYNAKNVAEGGCLDLVFEVGASANLTLAEITDSDNLLYGLEGYITTFSAPYATTIPAGVTAYYAESVESSDVVSLSDLKEGVVPANFGVVLVSDAQNVTMVETNSVVEAPTNVFLNSATGSVTLGANCYVLANGTDGKGLYHAKEGLVLPANKAYLEFTSSTSALRLAVGETTGIAGVATEKANAAIYDLSGRRVLNTVKGGIYIQNGKKFIVK